MARNFHHSNSIQFSTVLSSYFLFSFPFLTILLLSFALLPPPLPLSSTPSLALTFSLSFLPSIPPSLFPLSCSLKDVFKKAHISVKVNMVRGVRQRSSLSYPMYFASIIFDQTVMGESFKCFYLISEILKSTVIIGMKRYLRTKTEKVKCRASTSL